MHREAPPELAVLYRAGLRITDAPELRPKDLDLAHGMVRVLCGKGGKARTVGIDAGAVPIIEEWALAWQQWGVGPRSPLYCSRSGRRLTGAYKDRRTIPMFPELRGPLMEAFERADEGEEFVIPRRLCPAGNLRTTVLRLIDRAGLSRWCKPFQNMRSSRQTELAEAYPIHVVCAWLGNSVAVATASYLQVTDAHLARAIAGTGGVTGGAQTGGGEAAAPEGRDVGQRAANGAKVPVASNDAARAA